jgi:hypothetical protein
MALLWHLTGHTCMHGTRTCPSPSKRTCAGSPPSIPFSPIVRPTHHACGWMDGWMDGCARAWPHAHTWACSVHASHAHTCVCAHYHTHRLRRRTIMYVRVYRAYGCAHTHACTCMACSHNVCMVPGSMRPHPQCMRAHASHVHACVYARPYARDT